MAHPDPASVDQDGRALRPERGLSHEQVRLHRVLLLCGAGGYFGWWFFVHFTLPDAFNPFLGRVLVVASFVVVLAASYRSHFVCKNLPGALAICCGLVTAHYFYLLERNHADLNWVIGSYITITVVCAILQTARSLFYYSAFVALLSAGLLAREPTLSFVVFMPGTLTILLFANLGLGSRLSLLAQLEESRQRIESLFDAGFEAIAVEDQGIIREVNGALSRLVGRPKEQLIGTRIDEILVAPAEARSGASSREAELLQRDGSRIAVEVIDKGHLLNGRPMRLLALRDLTERKQAEEALLFANRELESFSYSVAHDLRAPLRRIDGFSHALVEDCSEALGDTGQGYVQRIHAQVQRMGELIDNLIELARVGRAEISRQRLDLSRLATQIVEQLRSQEPDRNVTWSIQEGIFVEADRRLLTIVLENLIGNALKFTAKTPEAKIEIVAGMQSGSEVVSVRDNGAGFDMAYASKLFAPFQRLHRADEFPGTGIGLATVQRIVRRHGGRVWAESSLNRGATFHLTLSPGGYRLGHQDAE